MCRNKNIPGEDRSRPRLSQVAVIRALAALALMVSFGQPALAAGNAVLTGRITDTENRPVPKARVFLYHTGDVRQAADFISAPSDKDGRFRLVLPPGKYRAVARLRKKDGPGPLMPGDKHSGEPEEIELASEQPAAFDFIVADLKDAIRKKKNPREGVIRVSGRITDESGSPLQNAYAFAYAGKQPAGIPDFVSAWTDEEGRYVLYLSPGTYCLNASETFPPRDFLPGEQVALEAGRTGLDLVLPGAAAVKGQQKEELE